MAAIKKQVSLMLELRRFQLLRQEAARRKQPLTELLISLVDWDQLELLAQEDLDEELLAG